MASERTQIDTDHTRLYGADRASVKRFRRLSAGPIDAITLDRVELSGEHPEIAKEFEWLVSSIATMSSETVSRKMKNYLDSFPTIDDALAEKLVMEAL
jgi:hypothetical protein